MNFAKNIRGSNFRAAFRGTVQVVLVTGVLSALVFTAAGFIFWDADFYIVRDKWEHFKIAMFGDWKLKDKVLSDDDFLDGYEQLTFFKTEIIDDVGTVSIGARFTSITDLHDQSPSNQWCYLSIGAGVASQRIELAQQSGEEPAFYETFGEVPMVTLAELKITRSHLSDIARTKCVFIKPDPLNQSTNKEIYHVK